MKLAPALVAASLAVAPMDALAKKPESSTSMSQRERHCAAVARAIRAEFGRIVAVGLEFAGGSIAGRSPKEYEKVEQGAKEKCLSNEGEARDREICAQGAAFTRRWIKNLLDSGAPANEMPDFYRGGTSDQAAEASRERCLAERGLDTLGKIRQNKHQ